MWRDSVSKRRARYMYLLKHADKYHETAAACLEATEAERLTKQGRVIRDVSVCVLAPAINAFTIWVLRAALKKGISRLYFLARDGYFMYTTAKRLCEMLHLPIECRYLSCSRYSIRIPMFHFNIYEAFDYIVRGGIDVTLDKVLNRAGLSQEEKTCVIQDIGDEFTDGVIPYADLSKLRTRLEASEVFISALKGVSERAFPAARDYLEEEGLFDDVSFAFVDSGWTGSMQKVLGQLLDKCGHRKRLHGFYWGLYELPSDVNSDDYECFYFGPTFGTGRKVGFSNCLYESIFSAPHGMTLRYENKGGKAVPVYADIRKENKEFNELTGKYLELFTERLALKTKQAGERALSALRLKSSTGKKEDILKNLLDTFMGAPSAHEAEIYGSLPFSDDVLDENEQQVAPLLSQEELRTNYPHKKILILTGISKERIRESAWYEGSAVRSGGDVQRHLKAYRAYKWLLYGKKEAIRLKSRIESFRK